MPFKSEAQRRYLWANEPEIARDWADTYGSRIEAALGGIMRLGFYQGGGPHGNGGGNDNSADRGGNVQRAIAQQAIDTASTRSGDDTRELAIEKYATNPYGLKTKGPLDKGFDLYKKYAPLPNAWRFAKKIFGPSVEDENPYSTGRFTVGNPHLDKVTGPTTGPDRGDRPYIPPQYIDDVYAQNVMEEDDLDIDTSTGNMQDWVHNFRVDNQYRQDKEGQLDPQIREMINNLYT
jgi:hypothetical protein